jgi:hypothetical protein
MKRGIIAMVAALMFGVVTAAQAASLPVVGTEQYTGPYLTSPTQINLSTADYGFFIGGVGPHYGQIDWSYWNSKSASGTGVAWQNNCRPNCPRGTWSGFRVRLWLWQPALLNGREMFTRMKLAYRYNTPRYMPRQQVLHYCHSAWEQRLQPNHTWSFMCSVTLPSPRG